MTLNIFLKCFGERLCICPGTFGPPDIYTYLEAYHIPYKASLPEFYEDTTNFIKIDALLYTVDRMIYAQFFFILSFELHM